MFYFFVSVDAEEIGTFCADKWRTPCSSVITCTCSTKNTKMCTCFKTNLLLKSDQILDREKKVRIMCNSDSPGLSTLITSAPRSPSIMVAKGPARTLQIINKFHSKLISYSEAKRIEAATLTGSSLTLLPPQVDAGFHLLKINEDYCIIR